MYIQTKLGYGIKDFERTHLVWLVLFWKLKIYRRPESEEKIHIETWSAGSERVCSYRDYKLYDENNNLIAIATSKWALYNLPEAHLAKITPELLEAYQPTDEHVFENTLYKLAVPNATYLATYDYTVMRRDIDTNHHVHNSNYLDIANEVLPEDVYRNVESSNVEIMYKNQAIYGDKTKSFYYQVGSEHYVVIRSEDLSKLHCIIKLS